MCRYIELDISKPFLAVQRTIAPLCQSMAQVVHHRQEVVDVLLGALKDPAASLCWQSVLGLLAAMAKCVLAGWVVWCVGVGRLMCM